MREVITWDEHSKKYRKRIQPPDMFEKAFQDDASSSQHEFLTQETADVETPKHPESFQAQIDLNQQQLNAVQHPVDSKLMVVAGPGTGKTHVLVARVLYLIQLGVPPEKIVVTTFTNRVTSTLISRISQIAGSDISNRLQIHNFYSICQGLLHTFGAKLDIDTDFDVADEIELESITDDVVSSFTTYPRERDSIKSRIKKFYMSKQSGLDVEILKDDIVSNLVEKTQNILHERKLLSYHDLLELGTELVERFPSSVNQVEATLVDEFQDLSPLHWRFIKGLSQHSRSLTLVGDPDQSIFRFSGSRPELFDVAQNGIEKMSVVKLDINYRSVPSILSTANSLISQDTRRSVKSVVSSHRGFQKKKKEFFTCLKIFSTPNEENEWIASEICKIIKNGNSPSGIAILVRSTRDLKSLRCSLETLGIDYTLAGDKFWELPAFRKLFAMMKAIDQPGKDFYVEKCFSLEKGIGKVALSSVQKNMKILNSSFWEALTSKDQFFSIKVSNLINMFTNKIINGINIINEDPTNKIQVVKLLDYLFSLKEFESEILEHPEYKRYVKILYNIASNPSYTMYERKRSLIQNFMSNIRKMEFISSSNEITISTFHSAKGFEWSTVFIPRLNDNSLPAWFAHKSKIEIDEERRVLYVGITRAKHSLYMTYSTNTIIGPVAISRFLSPELRQTIGILHRDTERHINIDSSYKRLVSPSQLEQLKNVFRYPKNILVASKEATLLKPRGFNRSICTSSFYALWRNRRLSHLGNIRLESKLKLVTRFLKR